MGDWPEHNNLTAMTWLREQVTGTLEYARKNADRRPINPMRSHEMRDLTARCEAELAAIGEHRLVIAAPGGGWYHAPWRILVEEPTWERLWGLTSGVTEEHCRACRCRFPCPVLRLAASGYRHRDGYPAHWASAAPYKVQGRAADPATAQSPPTPC